MDDPRLHTLRPLVTRYGAAVLASLVLTALATAQSATRGAGEPPAYDTSGLELTLPDASPETPDTPMAAPADENEPVPAPPTAMEAPQEVPSAGVIGSSLAPIPASEADQLAMFGNYSVPAESSGTWLNRGMWYADVEAVIMARTWNNENIVLMQEFDEVELQLNFNTAPGQVTSTLPIQTQSLGESSPGYEAMPRLSLGRFLFRDTMNRDHTVDMVFFGGGELEDKVAAEAQFDADSSAGIDLLVAGDQRGLHIPARIDGSRPFDLDISSSFPSFDRASTMNVVYSSRFLDWELNYNVAERLRKDRMELLPTGQWIRRASPGITYNYGAGLRYFDLEERLDWSAGDVDSIRPTAPGATNVVDGFYAAHTTNDLYGVQLGFGVTYQSDRWNVTVSTKQGAYINDARARRNLDYIIRDGSAFLAGEEPESIDLNLHENGLSYIGTGSIVARYHLRQNWSLRAGWEFMFITGLALAPNEVNFNPATGQQLSLAGDVLYHGVSIGSEFYW